MPIGRCKVLLTEVYVTRLKLRPGDADFEQDLAADGRHFTAKAKGANNYNVTVVDDRRGRGGVENWYTCRLHLPGVLLTSWTAAVGSELPVTLPQSDSQPSKDEVIGRASLEGVQHLHTIGVLDEHLRVRGRSAALQRLREEAGAGRRQSSTRANKYALHVKEPILRKLPRLLAQPPPAEASGGLTVYAHPLMLEGRACELALLLRDRCPIRELLVGPEHQRRLFKLTEAFEVRLDHEQVQLVARWVVGSLDLVQAGCAGEPLHPSLHAPLQLMSFSDHAKGIFTPQLKPFGSALASPATGKPADESAASSNAFPEAQAWRTAWHREPHRPYHALVHQLAQSIKVIVARITAELPTDRVGAALIVTVDLDHTLWAGACLDWPVGTFSKLEASDANRTGLSSRQVFDERSGEILELHEQVPLCFDALRLAAVPLAVASASPAADSARALLRAFGLIDDETYPLAIEMGDSEEKRDGKKVHHLHRLAEQMAVPVDRFVLFDDGPANVSAVREFLACSALLVDPAIGLTAEVLLRGLEHRCNELRLRAHNIKVESEVSNPESRRKQKQKGDDAIAKGQADVDQGRVDSRLAALAVDPGWWLAAPLSPIDDKELDWTLIGRATELYSTCQWPCLEDGDHPLVADNVPMEEEELQPGPIPLCALATYESERNTRHNLLRDVTLDLNGTVSGNVRTRRVNVAATAAKRIVQADGTFQTQDTERAGGYKPRNVQLLPLRSSHHVALGLLKRLLWRLEHLLLISDSDVASLLHMPSTAANGVLLTSAPTVPLELLSAALTHPGASAEAVHAELPPEAPLNRFRHEERG